MSKILTRLTQLALIVFFVFLFSPKVTLAANCTFTSIPDPPNQNMDTWGITVQSNELMPGKYYVVFVQPGQKLEYAGIYPFKILNLGPTLINFDTGQSSSFKFAKPNDIVWNPGSYTIRFIEKDHQLDLNFDPKYFCQTTYDIAPLPPQACSIAVETPNYPNTGVVMVAQGLAKGDYDIYVNKKILDDWGKSYHIYRVVNEPPRADLGNFPPGNYTIDLFKAGDCAYTLNCKARPQCNQGKFTVIPRGTNPPPTSDICDITPSPPISQLNDIFITSTKLQPKTQYYADRIKTNSNDPNDLTQTTTQTSSDQGVIQIYLGKVPIGNYIAHIIDNKNQPVCEKTFSVQDEAEIAKQKLLELQKCISEGRCTKGGGETCNDGRGPTMKTAIGCIHTNPSELVKDLMTFIIGIGGGLAFLMMLFGAFQMLTSAGNPETLNAGRSRLTSAVIGLLFIIFTVLLLQIIGADILKIPGFER